MTGKKTIKNERKYYISVLYVISALAVIMLHANTGFWVYREGNGWLFNDIIECLFYFAVPIFFMLVGATLFDYQDRYDTKTFFKRRFVKILIPFIFWSFFGLFFFSVLRGQTFSLTPLSIWNDFFEFKYVSIFWFFIPLICMYLAVPLFASIDKKKKKQVLLYLAIAGLVLNILVPFIFSTIEYFSGKTIAWPLKLEVVGGYLLYPVIGYLLSNMNLNKKQRIIIYTLAFCALMVHLIGTYCLSRESMEIVRLFKGYTKLPCVLYSIGVFVFIKHISEAKFMQRFSKLVLFLTKYTFAFYIIHRFVLVYMADFWSNFGIQTTSVIFVPIAFVLTVPICIVITWIVRKIPGGKYVLP